MLLLDSYFPQAIWARWLLWLWLKLVVPILGAIFTGEAWAYEYLAASIKVGKSHPETRKLWPPTLLCIICGMWLP